MGDSMGIKTPFSLSHPYLAQILQVMGSGAAGAAAGGEAAPVTGALGALAGILMNRHFRNSGESGMMDQARQALAQGRKPDVGAIGRPGSSLLTPISGIFQQGRMDTADNVLTGNKQFGTNPMRTVADVLQGGLPSFTASESPLSLLSSMLSNHNAVQKADKLGL